MADRVADLMSVLTRDFDMSRYAAQCLLAHGQVSIDGYTIQPTDVRRWKIRQLRGRMLKAGRHERRLYSDGGRISADHDQQAMML